MEFKETLLQVADDFEMELRDLCFCVSTESFDFHFSFFAFEDDDFLGVLVTDEEGMERLHLIVKSEIVYIRIHYSDEIELFVSSDDNTDYRDVGRYE